MTAIITVFDSGGSTGRLREHFQIPAVGDLRKSNSALLPAEFAETLEARLPSGHAVGNLAFTFLAQQYGFKKAGELYLDPRILPVSLASSQIVTTLENGQKLVGEHLLDLPPKSLAKLSIRALALRPAAELSLAAAAALKKADLIVVGPGSLFGSLLVHFAVAGFTAAFQKAKAQKILILPAKQAFGHRGDSTVKTAARFPVQFDAVWTTTEPKWERKKLVQKILKVVER